MIKLKSLLSEGIQKLIVYHGTGERFRKFDLNRSTQGIIWFTSDKDSIASGENGAYGRKYIITAEVLMKNPAGWDEYHKKSVGELQRDNFDGVILPDDNDRNFDCFVWNTNQIKILKFEKV
jgi:hypothetical protein